MKRFLLLALTAGLLSPIAAKAEGEFTELMPINPFSYQKSSLNRWNEEGKIIDFKVMIRPLQAIGALQKKMSEALESLNK